MSEQKRSYNRDAILALKPKNVDTSATSEMGKMCYSAGCHLTQPYEWHRDQYFANRRARNNGRHDKSTREQGGQNWRAPIPKTRVRTETKEELYKALTMSLNTISIENYEKVIVQVQEKYTKCIKYGVSGNQITDALCKRIIADKRHVAIYTRVLLDVIPADQHGVAVEFCKSNILGKFEATGEEMFDFRGSIKFVIELYVQGIEWDVIKFINEVVDILYASRHCNEGIYEICTCIIDYHKRMPEGVSAQLLEHIKVERSKLNNRSRFRVMDAEDAVTKIET